MKKDEYHRLEAKVKSKIKRSHWFKNGKIYIPTTSEDYQSFEDYNVSSAYDVNFERAIEQKFGSKHETVSSKKTHEQQLDIDKRLLQKAIQRNKFYRYSNLKQYVPNISSMKEFIEGTNFLGNLSIWVSLPVSLTVEELTPFQKLKIVERFLAYAEKNIRSNYMKVKGTPIFEGHSLPKFIDDYVIELSKARMQQT